MKSEQGQFARLGSSQSHAIEYEAAPLGVGAQGAVHRVVKIDGRAYGTWALKLLDQSSAALIERLQALVEFFEANALNSEGLACVPAAVLERKTDKVLGIAMRCAPGPDLETGGGVPAAGSLPKRLAAALQLARTVRRLHERNVVVGDLAHDNLIIDPRNWALYAIDLDGVAFSKDKFYPLLADNSTKGELCPPELTLGQSYTAEMDRWGLAVLLHYLLTDENPMGLFGLARTYSSNTISHIWPPPGHPQRDSHLARLARYGDALLAAFGEALGEGRLDPARRPTADAWETMMAEAQRHLYVCNCDPATPFVAIDEGGAVMTVCPQCQSGIAARATRY